MFDLVAFDLYGTLLDIDGLTARIEPLVKSGAAELLAQWRKAQVAASWECNRSGRFEPWDRVTAAALKTVAPGLEVEVRERLCRLWRTLPAFPDAKTALENLRHRGVRVAILSNGTRGMISEALSAAGLSVDDVLSAEDVGVYKTDPRVYALLDGLAPREQTLFVSSNGWDADGARRDGRTVAWIDRGGEPPATAPDFRISSLAEVPRLS